MQNQKSIDYRFKLLYTFGIIMVVCGHTPGGGIVLLSDWFPYGGLHLALFAFCSGYFYKSSAEDSVLKYFLKKMRTLIIPLYIYTLVYGLIVQVAWHAGFAMGGDFNFSNLVIAPITSGHQFIYNMGGWFVVPLFMVEMLNVLIETIQKKGDYSITLEATEMGRPLYQNYGFIPLPDEMELPENRDKYTVDVITMREDVYVAVYSRL